MKTIGPNAAVVLSGVTLATGLAAAVLGVGFTASPAQAAAAQPTPAVVVPAATAPAAAPVARKPAKPTHTTEPTTTTEPTRTPSRVDYSKCTNRINYGNDPRSNATINSIGEQTGRCPKPLTSGTGGTGGGGAGSTNTCTDTGTCYDPAGSAPGEGLSDIDFHSSEDVNGETFYDYCARTGQPVSTCAAG